MEPQELLAEARAYRLETDFDNVADVDLHNEIFRNFIGDAYDPTYFGLFTNPRYAHMIARAKLAGMGGPNINTILMSAYNHTPTSIIRGRAFYNLDIQEGWLERYITYIETISTMPWYAAFPPCATNPE